MQIRAHTWLTSVFSQRVHSVPQNQNSDKFIKHGSELVQGKRMASLMSKSGPCQSPQDPFSTPCWPVFQHRRTAMMLPKEPYHVVRSIHLLGAILTEESDKKTGEMRNQEFFLLPVLPPSPASGRKCQQSTHRPRDTKRKHLGPVGCVVPTSPTRTKYTCVCRLRNANGNFRVSAYKSNGLPFAF